MFCTKCGTNIAETSKFCPKCGTPVNIETAKSDEAPASVAQTQPLNAPGNAQLYAAPPQQPQYAPPTAAPSYNETSTTVTSADTQLFNAIPTNAPSYSMPTQPTPMNAGDQKRNRKIWIPIVAGVVVLALAFGALSLFTNVFPWSTGKYEEETTSPTRRRDEDNDRENVNDNTAAATPGEPSAESPMQTQDPLSQADTTPPPEPDEIDVLKAKADAYLDALDCPIMDERDNRIGMRVLSIEKVDDGYKIYWHSDNGGGNEAFIFSLMRFFDPDDYSNNYQPFTISDGSLNYTFGAGDIIGYTEFRVRGFEPDCMMLYMYFGGALESMGAPPEIQTEPLFFTFVLGDEPALVEEAPRFANGIFDGYDAPADEPGGESSFPAEYVGQWIGYADGSYLEFIIEPDGSGVYTLKQDSYSESYDFTLEIGAETFSVSIPRNNSSGIAAIEGTYEYIDGMLILDIITTLDSGGVIKRTVPCVRVSGSGADAAKEVADRDYEIQTAIYDMKVVYIGEWRDGKPNGAGIAVVMEDIPGLFDYGDTLAGMWVDGLLQGPGVYISFDGLFQLRGTFIDGLKEGTVQVYVSGEYLYDMEFVNGSPVS